MDRRCIYDRTCAGSLRQICRGIRLLRLKSTPYAAEAHRFQRAPKFSDVTPRSHARRQGSVPSRSQAVERRHQAAVREVASVGGNADMFRACREVIAKPAPPRGMRQLASNELSGVPHRPYRWKRASGNLALRSVASRTLCLSEAFGELCPGRRRQSERQFDTKDRPPARSPPISMGV